MQVKKFEAPTIQEALEVIKRELGPEAIILQTKKNKRGFGLMSRASVEVTAAVSERSLQKKQFTERRLPDDSREAIRNLPADRQAGVYDKYTDKHLDQYLEAEVSKAQDRVDVSRGKGRRSGAEAGPASQRKMTTTRYADIDDAAEIPVRSAGAPRASQDKSGGSSSSPVQDRTSYAAAGHAPYVASAQEKARLQARMQSQAAVQDAVESAAAAARSVKVSSQKPIYTGPHPDMGLDEEVKHLKRMIEEIRQAQDDGLTPSGPAAGAQSEALAAGLVPTLRDAFEQLVLNGVDRRFAHALAKKVGFELGPEQSDNPEAVLDQLAAEIMSSTEVLSPLAGIQPRSRGGTGKPVILALVGPTGVGKTTTIAKIASEAILKRNLKVGLLNLDSYKVAAFDQLATYAKILNVPFRSAGSAEDLKAAIVDFQNLDVVIVDTTGRSQRDPDSLREMESTLSAIPDLRTHLVLSATTRDTELYDMANRFSMFRPQGIIVSKLDEATIYGAIYNVSQKAKLPLLYFTTGQRVPEDIEEASRERIVALIMDL